MNMRSLLGEVLGVLEKTRDGSGVARRLPAGELPHLPDHREAGKRVAERILHNEADAEEAVDQAICEIAVGLYEPLDIRAAVMNKTRQRAIDRWRKRKRQRTEVNTDTTSGVAISRSLTPHDEVEVAECLELLDAAIGTLPSEDQLPATRYFREGYTVTEIADILGVEYHKVYRGLARSRLRLQDRLPSEYHEQLRRFPERPWTTNA
jgi:RNA polymerase sigma factor (sigma-70 family)